MAKETEQQGLGRIITLRESEIKICELCGGLNLATNPECFICGWHGRFERDTEAVRAAIELAMRRHGRLELQHLTDLRTYRRRPASFRERVVRRLGALLGWLRR